MIERHLRLATAWSAQPQVPVNNHLLKTFVHAIGHDERSMHCGWQEVQPEG